MEQVLSIMLMATGTLVASVGVVSTRHRIRVAQRTHQKTITLCEAIPEGWGSWFLGGFSGLTMGTRWLRAAAAWCMWTLAGVCLIVLGFRLFYHV